MNWKGFEGISRRFMEALLWHPEMVEKPQNNQSGYLPWPVIELNIFQMHVRIFTTTPDSSLQAYYGSRK
jgi:hypothetical protein